jgi:hypothetical protein
MYAAPRCRLSHPVSVVRRPLEQRQVVAYANERSRVALEHDDRERAEDCIDGAALEAELAEVGTREQRVGFARRSAGSGARSRFNRLGTWTTRTTGRVVGIAHG